jgi:hypothetical protein
VRLKLIACEILYREFCAALSRSTNHIDVEFLSKGLHDMGSDGMSRRLKEVLHEVDEKEYDAVLFGYALCSNGLVGLSADTVPLVIPRAHDCISLFLGSKERYLEYFQANPGTYFKTTGWLERGADLEQLDPQQANPDSQATKSGMNMSYEQLVERYGEDNAKFLYEELCNMTRNYGQLTYIGMGIEPDDRFEQQARQLAKSNDWKFDNLTGDMGLIQALVDGPWDEDRFLVVQPGERIAASFDEGIIKAEKDE